MAITNKEILEEVEKLKKMIPTANGDFILLKKTVGDLEIGQQGLKDDIKELKERLLNPDNGVVARVNKNSEFRKKRFGTERLKIIEDYKKEGSLLDIGCGIGWFLEVAMSNFDVKGVEISDSLRTYLKKNKGIDSFKYIDDIPDNTADVITGFDLIEFIETRVRLP